MEKSEYKIIESIPFEEKGQLPEKKKQLKNNLVPEWYKKFRKHLLKKPE